MNDKVNLLTTNLQTGEKKITTGYDKEVLEKWIAHAKSESAEGVLSWEIIEEEEE